ncbi:MAG: hypothetical protein ACRBFS_27150 [Aureispira sp.]
MQQSKLVTLLKHLNSRELSRFCDYVDSPFFNKHQEAKKLVVYLSKYILNDRKQHFLDKERISKHLYPKRQYNSNILNTTVSRLLSLLHDFLVLTNNEDKHNQHLIKVLAELRRRKQNKDYRAILRKIDHSPESDYRDIEDLYWEKVAYHRELDRQFVTQGGRTYNENLQLKNDYLDLFFITKKLKIACDMVSRNIVIGSNYQYRLVDELLEYLDQPDSVYAEEPTLIVYAGLLRMLLLGQEGDEQFNQVKESLLEHRSTFSKEELKNIYDYLENHCIKRYNHVAEEKYLHEMLSISKYLVEYKINFVDGYLSDGDYKNIGTTAINLGDHEWAEQFIEQYQYSLLPKDRNSAYSLLMAYLYYAKMEYRKALEALHDVTFTNYTYHIGAKVIQLKVYYETEEGEALHSLSDAFRNYIRRSKKLTTAHKAIYENFTQLLSRSYRFLENHAYWNSEKVQREYKNLKEAVETTYPLANRTWLCERVAELQPESLKKAKNQSKN